MAERRIGCLLSGGLDSSLIAALVVKLARENDMKYPIQTFSIGFPGSEDCQKAKKVADMLGTEHHEIIISPEDGFNAIKDVSYALECYDLTTHRSSIPMYVMCKYIREKTDTVVIFSGEGSDELTQGYIYFHKAPSTEAAHEEAKRLLRDLYLHDNLRADRTVAANGLELRVPFLDKAFTSYYLSLDKELLRPKDGIEKHLLRSAFEGHLKGLLPDEILWRPKEAFSDGVTEKSQSWPQQLRRYAESQVTEEILIKAQTRIKINPPTTSEHLYYRLLFEEKFPGQEHLTPFHWMPKWMGDVGDPSAKLLENYK